MGWTETERATSPCLDLDEVLACDRVKGSAEARHLRHPSTSHCGHLTRQDVRSPQQNREIGLARSVEQTIVFKPNGFSP